MQNDITLLINACKKGDQRAQMRLYDSYSKAMYNIACRYLNDEDAKDAMQEGFLKAFLKMDSYKQTHSFGAWLKRIIINQCIDVLKKRTLDTDSIEETAYLLLDDNTELEVEMHITKEMIETSIEKLSRKYQVVLRLYLMEGYDHEEISEIMNIPAKTSRTHLHRGKHQLQKALNNYTS